MTNITEEVMKELHKDDPMRYFVVKTDHLAGQMYMRLVKEFKTLGGALRFAHANRKTVWLFAAPIIGKMHTNTDLFFEQDLALRYVHDEGWHQMPPPHVRYFRTIQGARDYLQKNGSLK